MFTIAPVGQFAKQFPHIVHFFLSITATSPSMEMASEGQFFTHFWQPMQAVWQNFLLTTGLSCEAQATFIERETGPTAMTFFGQALAQLPQPPQISGS